MFSEFITALLEYGFIWDKEVPINAIKLREYIPQGNGDFHPKGISYGHSRTAEAKPSDSNKSP